MLLNEMTRDLSNLGFSTVRHILKTMKESSEALPHQWERYDNSLAGIYFACTLHILSILKACCISQLAEWLKSRHREKNKGKVMETLTPNHNKCIKHLSKTFIPDWSFTQESAKPSDAVWARFHFIEVVCTPTASSHKKINLLLEHHMQNQGKLLLRVEYLFRELKLKEIKMTFQCSQCLRFCFYLCLNVLHFKHIGHFLLKCGSSALSWIRI